ncbi:MAG: hypothetical protein RIT27_986 [Pseudomonadota bacterium]|jgi:DNA-binding NarL/FixJ family response regulator
MHILLADDHALFRQGLVMLIEATFSNCSITECTNWEEVYQLFSSNHFDLVLLDIFMPRQHHWEEELETLIHLNSNIPICMISASSETEHIQTAFQLGVKGYLCKTAEPQEITRALLEISRGNEYFPLQLQSHLNQTIYDLTLRQQEILKLMANGQCNKSIARQLNISESTVKRHLYNTYQILNAHNRVEAIEIARQKGLLSCNLEESYDTH